MKTIIAGSRDFNSYDLLDAVINYLSWSHSWHITEVVSGRAAGVDQTGEVYAEAKQLPLVLFPANWEKHGRSAGVIRNEEMAKYADALIAIQLNNSKGTEDMIKRAKTHDLRTFIIRIEK